MSKKNKVPSLLNGLVGETDNNRMNLPIFVNWIIVGSTKTVGEVRPQIKEITMRWQNATKMVCNSLDWFLWGGRKFQIKL